MPKKRVKFVNYPKQYLSLKEEIDSAISRCLNSGDFILRSEVSKLEDSFSSFCGKKYGIGVGNGTDALYLSLKALNIGPEDEVITVSNTFIATISAISMTGAKPILIDVNSDNNMNPNLIEHLISNKTKAIIPVHLAGRVCDMNAIQAISEKHKIPIIEDAAQAIGAKFKDKKAGSFGLLSCFSFYPSKILGSYGDAGMILTDSEEIANKLKALRNQGRVSDKIPFLGVNSRLDNIQAAILNVKFSHLQDYIQRRREIASTYNKELQNLPISLPPAPSSNPNYLDVYQDYLIRIPQDREKLISFLEENGIETLPPPIANHLQPCLQNSPQLPMTELLSQQTLRLPTYPELEDSEVLYITEKIKEFFKISS